MANNFIKNLNKIHLGKDNLFNNSVGQLNIHMQKNNI